MRSYDYATRKGIRAVSWEDVAEMSRRLAESLEAEKVDIVLGIARAGLIPATVVAGEIRRELYPIRLTRRINDEIVFKRPRWLVQTPPLGGKTVGIIDEIADTGETLRLARQSAQNAGAGRIVTATMVTHSWAAPRPDIAVVATDELIVWPWDAEVLIDGQWQLNPELAAAAALQDDPDAVSRILIRPLERPAKSHGSAGERNVHSEH